MKIKTLRLNLHSQPIVFDKPQSIQCEDGVCRMIDKFYVKHCAKKTVKILLAIEDTKISTVTKRLKFLGKDIVKNGLITVNFNKKEYTVGTWELCEEEV